jgi:hypothetical protein
MARFKPSGSCRGRLVIALTLGTGLLLQLPAPSARADRRETLLKLLQRKPRRMATETWREQRREAARELGRLKETRAVPSLLKIIDSERFDVILEIAIDALGEIGDKRAVDPLKRLLDDPSLDAYVRDAAASALNKLQRGGGRPPPTPPGPQPVPRPLTPRTTPTGEDEQPVDWQKAEAFPHLAQLGSTKPEEGTIARSSTLDLVVGSSRLAWDGRAQRTDVAFDLRSRVRHQLERRKLGYTIDGVADLGFDFADPPDQESAWTLGHGLQINPEVRFYPFSRDLPQLFGQISGGAGYGLTWAKVPFAPDKRFAFAGTVTAAGGPGYGRLLDIGPRLRLKRVERVLRKAGLLEQPIDKLVATELIATWYRLRDTLGSYHLLGHTLQLLRRAKLLAERPVDPATTYRLVRILDDPQLDHRISGVMARVGYGYARHLIKDADDRTLAFFYTTCDWHQQRGTTRALGATMRFFYNMWDEPDTFNLQLKGTYDWYLYNRAFDAVGAITATVDLGLNRQPGAALEDGGLGYRLLGGLSYSRFHTRAARLSASLLGGAQSGGGLIMLTVEAAYGFARGAFVVGE